MRVWVPLGAAGAWLAFGFVGRATGIVGLDVVAGLFLLAALGTGAWLVVEHRREAPNPPAREARLFPPVGDGRWCDRCGRVAARDGPCAACGAPVRHGRRS